MRKGVWLTDAEMKAIIKLLETAKKTPKLYRQIIRNLRDVLTQLY